MWPFTVYPERSLSDINGKTYDYVIVGGGTAGCVLASRLSEDPSVSVLLIERGYVKNNLISRVPLLSQNLFWTKTLQVQDKIWSEPIESAYGRKNRLWAVNGIGGASRLNAMLWTRGSPGDYTMWSKLGLTDWCWEKVEPYFRRLERVEGSAHPSHQNSRGCHGPIQLRKPLYSFQWIQYLKVAAHGVGLATFDSCNDPTAPSYGYFPLETAIDKNGERVSTLTSYLSKEIAQERVNHLSVCTGTVATRLEIIQNDGKDCIVSGVHVRSSSDLESDFEGFVKARREVILACGAMTTPQLLLLSGIGPSGDDSVESQLGIPLIKKLPAVGATFSDHYSIPIMLEIPLQETLHFLESALWGLWHFLVWIFMGKGLMSLSSAPAAIFLHTDAINEETMQVTANHTGNETAESKVPNIEVMIIPLNSLERAVPGRSLFSIYPTILQPRATGRLKITSRNPLVNPSITHPMLGHEDDLRATRLAVRFSMRLASEFQKFYPFPAPFAFAPGNEAESLCEWEQPGSTHKGTSSYKDSKRVKKTWKDVTDVEIDDYMRRVGHTALHFTSTCPMGLDEQSGVVDQKLLVFGFKNLRIADASVFPKITSGHTMAPVLMIAERCVDFVKGAWKDSDIRKSK
ncbi:GMC oxidoreductase [Aaosphaeria arxii CBS 175.79]|uniref:GMC oxidoreductase n=1 Tax=Aaosphaeria arxii CBS 175.79 TaxID=1450172 RepID=A0A6A5X8V2_9PLEO|nr:GMC oxidoreductase [Aaosphaeria arxii CBS 175.79]KAF2009351.1 GMC oxidoreductase [Aaosphaeria arxii CBS 175.79]